MAADLALRPGDGGCEREVEEGTGRSSRLENGLRRREAIPMLRSFPPAVGSSSPWGLIDGVCPLGPDAVEVTTASHGGIRVALTALARIPEPLRETSFSRDGWFEEDCDWAIPYLVLGLDRFEPTAARGAEVFEAARRTLARFHPQHVAAVEALVKAADHD